ncbi:uncharacterized protein V6R79_025709 [Siganus canaliculatus]
MKFLLSSLLLASLCALSSWSASSDAAVTQSPDVTVSEGDTVELSCCWTVEYETITVQWLKNKTIVKSKRFEINDTNEQLTEGKADCWNLNLTAVTEKDAGTYICKVTVDIPGYVTAEGSGTVITVTAKDNTTHNVPEGDEETSSDSMAQVPQSVIISLAVVCPLLLAALCCFCILKRKEAQAARVIYEVPHTDSDVADMDKHSTTSSRGSSQWCQVPVYESFDYFERVQTKGTG